MCYKLYIYDDCNRYYTFRVHESDRAYSIFNLDQKH